MRLHLVPFGKKYIEGIVIGVKNVSEYPPEKIKPIYKALEEIPALTSETLALMDYVEKTVEDKFNKKLTREIKLIGEF